MEAHVLSCSEEGLVGRGRVGGAERGVSRAQSAMLQIQEKSRTLSRHDDTHTQTQRSRTSGPLLRLRRK